jgi:hypothetical protein
MISSPYYFESTERKKTPDKLSQIKKTGRLTEQRNFLVFGVHGMCTYVPPPNAAHIASHRIKHAIAQRSQAKTAPQRLP